MANRFEITLVAVDRATAVVRSVNRALARVTAPISRLRASMRNLSAEMGLDKVGKGLANVGREALDVTQRFTAMLTPLSALLGFSTIAGVLELGRAWAMAAWSITQAAIASGRGVAQVQQLAGAGKLLGIDAQTTNAAMVQFLTTLEDAKFGRNQTALAMLRQLGVGFRVAKSGAIDVARSFEDMARAIGNPRIAGNPAVQNLIARTFGLEQMLPLLRQGPAAINALIDRVKAAGYVMDEAATQRGAAFQQSLFMLDITATGLRNTIGDRLIPILQPMIERLSAWVAANRALIATKVGEAVGALADAINRIDWAAVIGGTKEFIGSVQRAVDFVGGWKNAMIGLVAIMNAGTILAVVNLTTAVLGLGWAMGGTTIKAVASFGLALTTGIVAPAAAAVTALGGIGAAAMVLMNTLAPLFMAGSLGYGTGKLIDKAIAGTKAGDAVGSAVAHTMAFFGNQEAKDSISRMNGTSAGSAASTTPAAASPYRKTAAAAPGGAAGAPASPTPGAEPNRIELWIRGLPAGARAMMTGGGAPLTLRIGDAMPTEVTP